MTGFARIPPDSTGKKVLTNNILEIDFDNQTGIISVGDVITGATSGANGIVLSIVTVGFTANTGKLFLKSFAGTFSDNESLEITSTPVALVNLQNLAGTAQQDLHAQNVIVSDPINPTFQQRVDRFGATINTFTEGSPLFGPFGQLMTVDAEDIGEYSFIYSDLANKFYDNTASGGTITRSANDVSMLLSCPTTTGAIAQRTSNKYHLYKPGTGNLAELSLSIGDTGKANVRRRWGYFDDNNGLFWELDGTTLYVVLRSDTTGSVVDTRIAQTSWSNDKLDGTDEVGFSLDVSKTNVYWIDYQWLGAGRIRFGVFFDTGERIIAHDIQNANIGLRTFMKRASLPIRVEQENTSTSGSTSELRWICGVVKAIGTVTDVESLHFAANNSSVIQANNTLTPIISIRPKPTFGGIENHVPIIPVDVALSIQSATGPVEIKLIKEGSLTANNFTDHIESESSAQVDLAATAISSGRLLHGILSENGTIHISDLNKFQTDATIVLEADETTQQTLTIAARTINAGDTCNCYAIINWKEDQF